MEARYRHLADGTESGPQSAGKVNGPFAVVADNLSRLDVGFGRRIEVVEMERRNRLVVGDMGYQSVVEGMASLLVEDSLVVEELRRKTELAEERFHLVGGHHRNNCWQTLFLDASKRLSSWRI